MAKSTIGETRYMIPDIHDVIDIENISRYKFFNISYREHFCVVDNYIIGVYPFATILTLSSEISYNGAIFGKPATNSLTQIIKRYIHIDFECGKIDFDPCAIYELVSGTRIHHGETDWHLIRDEYCEEQSRLFIAEIISQKRNSKLDELDIWTP